MQVRFLSLDPAMRGWMNEGKSYIPPVGIGEVMRAGAAGTVTASKHEKFKVGDVVTGAFGVQQYALYKARTLCYLSTITGRQRLTKVPMAFTLVRRIWTMRPLNRSVVQD